MSTAPDMDKFVAAAMAEYMDKPVVTPYTDVKSEPPKRAERVCRCA
jgi:hypothetical protein